MKITIKEWIRQKNVLRKLKWMEDCVTGQKNVKKKINKLFSFLPFVVVSCWTSFFSTLGKRIPEISDTHRLPKGNVKCKLTNTR